MRDVIGAAGVEDGRSDRIGWVHLQSKVLLRKMADLQAWNEM